MSVLRYFRPPPAPLLPSLGRSCRAGAVRGGCDHAGKAMHTLGLQGPAGMD